jgi:hypothetical protein
MTRTSGSVVESQTNASGIFQDHWYIWHLFNHCLLLSNFRKTSKEEKVITLPKPGKDPEFHQNLRPLSLLSTTGKLFEKVILKIVQKHIEERGLLNASQLGFRARHSTTLQSLEISTTTCLQLRFSCILKKHLIEYGTLACYINCLN